jgi:hypothetical protein
MGSGITKMAHPCRQFHRVNIDPRRGAVGLGDENDVQSFSCLAIIKIDLSQFLFRPDVLLAINLRMPRKARWPDRELNRAIGRRMADCFLTTRRVYVKIGTREFSEKSQDLKSRIRHFPKPAFACAKS